MQIKLDASAVSSLIEKDETFQLSIQQCVLENIARRYIKGVPEHIHAAMETAGKEMAQKVTKEYGSYQQTSGRWNQTFLLNSTIQADVKDQVRKAATVQINEMIETAIKEQMEYAKSMIAKRVASEVSLISAQAIKAEVDAKVAATVEQKVAEAIANLKL